MNIPFIVLTIEIANSFNYSYKDAEEYASWLKKSCLKEYRRQLEINKYRTITSLDKEEK